MYVVRIQPKYTERIYTLAGLKGLGNSVNSETVCSHRAKEEPLFTFLRIQMLPKRYWQREI